MARAPLPVLAAGAATLVALALAGVALGATGPAPGPVAMTASLAVSFGPLGLFVLRRLPGHPLGRLMVAAGAISAVAALAVCWSAAVPIAWVSQWAWWPPLAVIPVILLLTPDGRLPSPRWRPLIAVLGGAAGLATLALAGAALTRPQTLLTTLAEPPPAGRLLARLALGAVAVFLLSSLAVVAALVTRWWSADPLTRRQLACLLPSAVLLVVGLWLDSADVTGAWLPAVVALPLGLTVAILRYRLHDLDLYVHRGLVWLVFTGLAVATYAVTATAVGGMLASRDRWPAEVTAVGVVAAGLYPAYGLVQRGVNRLLYGRRDDPYAVLTRAGQHMAVVTDPREVLPRLALTLVEALRVPYAAITLTATDDSDALTVEHGRRAWEPQRFAMVSHGRQVGQLLVAPRAAGTPFSAAESGLLRDLAGQAALAAEACRSAINLERARERLVLAREEERRRLRRDLHDGVASAIVGARMLVEAARQRVQAGAAAAGLLQTLAAKLDACGDEVRVLVDELRPAALDDGLDRALAALAGDLPDPAPRVRLRVVGELTDLPAAVEVVAYRIVAEALTNVVKHAHAQRCEVELSRDDGQLVVRVADDGAGFAGPAGPGGSGRKAVGLASIRSRAEELGGRCEITATADGTVVQAVLPLRG